MPSWFRGDFVLIVDDVPQYCTKGPDVIEYEKYDSEKQLYYNHVRSQARYGDMLKISHSLGSGWYRARNLSSNKIITIRTGRHMARRGVYPYISDHPYNSPLWPSRGHKSNVPVKNEKIVTYVKPQNIH